MSLYYSPQLVRLLTEDRVREAQQARRHVAADIGVCTRNDRYECVRPSRLSAIRSIFAGRPNPSACNC